MKKFLNYFNGGATKMTTETFKLFSLILFLVALMSLLFGLVYEGLFSHPVTRNLIFIWLGFWFGLTAYTGLLAAYEKDMESRNATIQSADDERDVRNRYIEELEQKLREMA